MVRNHETAVFFRVAFHVTGQISPEDSYIGAESSLPCWDSNTVAVFAWHPAVLSDVCGCDFVMWNPAEPVQYLPRLEPANDQDENHECRNSYLPHRSQDCEHAANAMGGNPSDYKMAR